MTWIGPYGALQDVRSPRVSLPVSHTRQSSTVTLLSGQTVAQRAPRSSREWSWKFTAATSAGLRRLLALEQGVYGPAPWRWYDPAAAKLNMLPDVAAAAGIGEAAWQYLADTPDAIRPAARLTLHDGSRLAYSIAPQQELLIPYRDGVADPVPILPGRTYTATAHTAGVPATVSLVWCDTDGAVLSTVASATGTGRLAATGTAPAEAAGVLVGLRQGVQRQVLRLDSGESAATSDTDALDVTGDIDIRVHAGLDTWQHTDHQVLLAKYSSVGNQRGYELSVRVGGRLALTWSSDGTGSGAAFHRAEATAPLPLPDGAAAQVRATLDVNNGAGGWTASFYYGDETDWIPLGEPITGTGTTQIYANTAPVVLGMSGNGVLPAAGDYYGAQIRNGINGALVANPDFTTGWQPGDDAATPARTDSVGRAWALAGPAAIVLATVPVPGGQVGGLQLTETPGPVDWHPGMGIPRVTMAGIDHAYRVITSGDVLRDATVTVVEVA